jgi:hypothetical protein
LDPLQRNARVRRLREVLRDLQARRLLRRLPDRAGRHQLRHALLAEAISGELLSSERCELHGWVAKLMAGWNHPGVATHIAEHFAAARREAEELRWRVIAGRQVDAVYAPAEAASHWQRAVALSASAPITRLVEGWPACTPLLRTRLFLLRC